MGLSSYGPLSDFPRLFSPLGRIGLAIDLRLKPHAFSERHSLLLKVADTRLCGVLCSLSRCLKAAFPRKTHFHPGAVLEHWPVRHNTRNLSANLHKRIRCTGWVCEWWDSDEAASDGKGVWVTALWWTREPPAPEPRALRLLPFPRFTIVTVVADRIKRWSFDSLLSLIWNEIKATLWIK